MNTRSIGSRYESAACGYLIDKGYKILFCKDWIRYSGIIKISLERLILLLRALMMF